MKHERNIVAQKHDWWRLSRTLSRRVEVRPMEPDDLKYAWAAYKKGALAPMGKVFEADLSADEFRAAFEDEAAQYSEGWIVSANTKRGFMPIGMVLGALAPRAAYLVIVGVVWFPWASPRNVIEGLVSFFRKISKEVPAMLYARNEHKRAYEVCCVHGVLRRIGTSSIVFPGQQAAVFETRV